MTSVIEKAIRVIAPHRCIMCGNYNNVVCTACTYVVRRIEVAVCLLCGVKAADWRPCERHNAGIAHLQAATLYKGDVKELIHRFKFDHARDAYKPVATIIASSLPAFTGDWLVVPIPTVAAHIRQRSYDQALLIAKEVARQKSLRMQRLLRRAHDTRQVGATRAQRVAQAATVFEVAGTPKAAKILLIDDVCTTGATLMAAAKVLKSAGITEVWAATAAWQPPKTHKKKDR
jgi:competence protein ComFC